MAAFADDRLSSSRQSTAGETSCLSAGSTSHVVTYYSQMFPCCTHLQFASVLQSLFRCANCYSKHNTLSTVLSLASQLMSTQGRGGREGGFNLFHAV